MKKPFELDVGLSLVLDLATAAPTAPVSPFEVRELARAEVEPALGTSRSLARPLAKLDAIAPAGWRCFAAFEGGAPVHVSFVELRPGRPLLFGALTEPAVRGRGAFRVTVHHLAARLREEGVTHVHSSTDRTNRASVRAHEAAGFRVTARRYDGLVWGVSLRALVRRILPDYDRR